MRLAELGGLADVAARGHLEEAGLLGFGDRQGADELLQRFLGDALAAGEIPLSCS